MSNIRLDIFHNINPRIKIVNNIKHSYFLSLYRLSTMNHIVNKNFLMFCSKIQSIQQDKIILSSIYHYKSILQCMLNINLEIYMFYKDIDIFSIVLSILMHNILMDMPHNIYFTAYNNYQYNLYILNLIYR